MKRFLTFAFLLMFCATLAAAVVPRVEPDRKDGIYTSGETVTFRISAEDAGKLVPGVKLEYRLRIDGVRSKHEKIVTSDKPIEISAARQTPGWITIQVNLLDENGKTIIVHNKRNDRKDPIAAYTGAFYDKEKIAPARPCPADFDQFWANARKELDAVPMKATVISSRNVKDVKVENVSITCAGNAPVRGYIAMPKDAKEKSLPALLTVHGAGVRSAGEQSACSYASSNNCIAFDINAHGIENGRDAAFYEALKQSTLLHYNQQGKESRETYYFRGMFLRVMRALDYLKSLPQWDGKNLMVYGSSQGGAQTIVAAALDHDVTAAIAGVPAMCDHAGALAKRTPGWPKVDVSGKNTPVLEATAYYDMVNFAHLIHCPIVTFTGFADTTCSPVGVIAFYNQLPKDTDKKLYTIPQGRHGSSKFSEFQKTYEKFLRLH